MARARNIKPGFFKNEDLAECTPWARLCFAGLWTLADREGRLEDRPKRIKGELFPFDAFDVEPLLAELARYGFIVRYEKQGERFIQVSRFSTHQTPHYSEKPSIIPGPCFQESGPDDEVRTPGRLQEDSRKSTRIKRGSQPPDSLIPDSPNPEEDSDADASAKRLPPEDPKPKPMTAKDRVWLLGVALLGESGRGLLGKLCKAHGDEVVAEVLAEATLEKPLEPKAWVTASCEAKAKSRPAGGAAPSQAGLLDDPQPDWAVQAGFSDRFTAENAGCTRFTAKQFRDGRRVAA